MQSGSRADAAAGDNNHGGSNQPLSSTHQRLDTLLQKHLPEFLAALSAGLSPVKQKKRAQDSSPAGSAISSSIQRSFSAVELHDAGLDMSSLRQQQVQPSNQQQRWPGHMRTASTDAMADCWTDSGNSSAPGMCSSQQSSTGSASPEPEIAPDTHQPQHKRLPPCPVLWRPAPALIRGMPLAESREEPDDDSATARSAQQVDDRHQQQTLEPGQDCAAPPGQLTDGPERSASPSSPTAAAAAWSSSRRFLMSASITNLMQMLHGLLGNNSSSSSSKLQVDAPSAGDGLDMGEYMACYSPQASPRVMQPSSKSSRGSVAASPRASGSFPDLRLFWGDFSAASSAAPSRHPSNVNAAAAAPTTHLQPTGHQPGCVGALTTAAGGAGADASSSCGSAAAAPAGAPCSGARRALQLSLSPSKGAMLLHGPSRLSFRSSAQEAGSMTSADADDDQATTAVTAPVAQQPAQLAHHSPAVAAATDASGQQLPPSQPEPHQEPQCVLLQGAVQRQLFVNARGSTDLQSAAEASQQQQAQQQGPPSGVLSSKQQSMLRSLIHKQGGNRQLPAPQPPPANEGSTCLSREQVDAVVAGGTVQHSVDGVAASSCGKQPATPRDTSAAALLCTSVSQHIEEHPGPQAVGAHPGADVQVTGAYSAAEPAAQQQPVQSAPGLNEHTADPAVAATAAAAGPGAAAVPVVAPAGGLDVMASSMQRIASCLEEYLTDCRSPSVSPSRGRAPGSTALQPAVKPAAVSSQQYSSKDQGVAVPDPTAADAVQQVTPIKAAAARTAAVPVPPAAQSWSPAAAAAKARMLAGCSPSKLQQAAAPGDGSSSSDTWQAAHSMHADQNISSTGPGGAAAAGCWLHPGALRQAAAGAQSHVQHVNKQAPVRSQQQQEQQGLIKVPFQSAATAELPRGLQPPVGLGLNCQEEQRRQQQQQRRQQGQSTQQQLHAGTTGDPTAELHCQRQDVSYAAGGDSQLASLLALACKAVGVDLLQGEHVTAAPGAAPAVAAACLPQPHQWQQTQSRLHRGDHTAASHNPRLWRPAAPQGPGHLEVGASHCSGCAANTCPVAGCTQHSGPLIGIAAACTAAAADQCVLQQEAVQHLQAQSALTAPGAARAHTHHAVRSGEGQQPVSVLWRQQQRGHQQQPVTGDRQAAVDLKLLQPERATELRLLQHGQPQQPLVAVNHDPSWACELHGVQDNSTAGLVTPGDVQQRLVGPQQQQQQEQLRPAWRERQCGSNTRGPRPGGVGPKLVRLKAQQPAAAPLQPPVLGCTRQPGDDACVAAHWQHPTAEGNRSECTPAAAAAAAVCAPVVVDASKPLQQPVPWDALGWVGSGQANKGAAAAGAGGQHGAAAAGCRDTRGCSNSLGAGAAAARLLQGLAGSSTEATPAGSNGTYWQHQPWTRARPGSRDSTGPAAAAPAASGGVGGGGFEPPLEPAGGAVGCNRPQITLHRPWPEAQGSVLAARHTGSSHAGVVAAGPYREQHRAAGHPSSPEMVVVRVSDLKSHQQQQLAPWQQAAAEAAVHAIVQQDLPAPQQQQPGAQLQQQQRWQCTFTAPHSPIKSPRKHPVGRRWALLQRLKAVNRSQAAATVAAEVPPPPPAAAAARSSRSSRSDAAAQLVSQLQELMQGPGQLQGHECLNQASSGAGRGQAADPTPALTAAGNNTHGRPDLDAAAAMALWDVGPQPLQVSSSNVLQQQQQQEGEEEGQGGLQLPDQVLLARSAVTGDHSSAAVSNMVLDGQPSQHSAAAQASEVMPSQHQLVPQAHAAVQAASTTVEAAAGPEQQSLALQEREQGALELAQLILGAFERSGGTILPEEQAGSSSGCSWDLPNPFAGPGAPRFQEVMELQPDDVYHQGCSPTGWGPATDDTDGQCNSDDGLQVDVVQQYEQHFSGQPQLQQAGVPSSTDRIHHGCCFAACPRHIASTELGVTSQHQHSRPATSGGGRRLQRATLQQQQQRQQCSATRLNESGRQTSKAGKSFKPLQSARSASAGPSATAATAAQSTKRSQRLTTERSWQPSHTEQQQQIQPRRVQQGGDQQAAAAAQQPVSPHTWACQQTKQLDELWQQWHRQQLNSVSAAGSQQAAGSIIRQQQLLDSKERQELEDAYARAAAARSVAKRSAQHAAITRSERLRAELMDLGRMLAEVDTLAAQMEVESAQTAAAVQQFDAELHSRRQSLCTSGVCAAV